MLITVILTLVLACAAAFAAFIAYLKTTHLSARAQPGAVESFFADIAVEWAHPASLDAQRNPVALSGENLTHTRDHFARHCAVCHGNDGEGHTETGFGLYPPPPDLKHTDMSDGELFYTIKNGIRFTGMPAWNMPDDRIWELVAFIRRLPQLSPADLEAMDAISHVEAEGREHRH
jgi:mono/diheme cytochrome c family protein